MLVRILGTLTAAVTIAASAGWALQRRLIYLPLQRVPPIEQVLPGGEEITFTTADGLDLRAWFRPSGLDPGPAVLVLPGNGGNRAGRALLAQELARRGLSVLLVDYRGYGGNPGSPHEEGLYEDARAAREALVGRDDVDPDRVVYFGESLGAAVALALALEHPPAALVLRSPFTSLPDVARVHYPFVPAALLKDRYPSLEIVGEVDAPLFVAAGEADTIVPFEQSRELYEAAPQPKRIHAVAEAGHNEVSLFTGEDLLDAVARFLVEHDVLDGPA